MASKPETITHIPQRILSPRDTFDPNDSYPYYLHHGDSPRTILVSQLLQADNYPTWSRSMIMALSVKNKIGFIDGSITKPSTSSSQYVVWLRCNNMVISWILNSISKDLAASVIYIASAREIWSDPKDRLSQSNGPRVFQLQMVISTLSQDQMSATISPNSKDFGMN